MKNINLVIAFILISVLLISMMDMLDGQHHSHWSAGRGCHCDTSSSWSGDHHCHCPLGAYWAGYREKQWERPWEKNHHIYYLDSRGPPKW